MVEYSDILAHVKKLFPEKENIELTRMSYSIWKYGDIKDVSEISQKIKRNTNPKKKKAQPTEPRPSVYIASQTPLSPLTKEEIIRQKAEALIVKEQKKRKKIATPKLENPQKIKPKIKSKSHLCNHEYDDIIAESRGRCINGTFICQRCGRKRHIGYKYKGYIRICLQCKQRVCKKSCGSIWTIYTPMK